MARVRFIGPSARRRIEFMDGRVESVSIGDVIEVPDEMAAGMCNSGHPRMWELADGPPSRSGEHPVVAEPTKKHKAGKEDR